MTRIPSHSVADAPDASRSLLAEMIQFSPTGQPLNMHAQMAHSPAVLEAYVSLRRAAAHLGTLDQRIRAALMLTSAAAARERLRGGRAFHARVAVGLASGRGGGAAGG